VEVDRVYVDGVAEETRSYRDLIVWQKAMDLVPFRNPPINTLIRHCEGAQATAAIAFASPNKEHWIAAAHAERVHVLERRSSGAGLAMTMWWLSSDRFLASLALPARSRLALIIQCVTSWVHPNSRLPTPDFNQN
jgi:hypothetical protein